MEEGSHAAVWERSQEGTSIRWPVLVGLGQPGRTDDPQGQFPQLGFLDDKFAGCPQPSAGIFSGHVGPS